MQYLMFQIKIYLHFLHKEKQASKPMLYEQRKLSQSYNNISESHTIYSLGHRIGIVYAKQKIRKGNVA